MIFFLHKNAHHIISCKKSWQGSLLFFFHFIGRRRLIILKASNEIVLLYRLWRSFQVRKKWKLKEVSHFAVKLRGFCFLVLVLKEIMQKIIPNLTPWKNNNVIQLFSFQWHEIIIDYLFQVSWSNIKAMRGGDINKRVIFSDKSFQSDSFGWKKDLLNFFCYTKLYTFCILPAQSQHNKIKTILHKELL